jgi:DNA-binding TFAR19-related protein (PDSD5 family)
MQCEAARERLVAGLTGATTEEMAEVERHLEACAACRAESASLTHLWDTLGAINTEGPDAAATLRMRGRLDALLTSHHAGPAVSWRARYALQAMAAIVVLALGLALGMGIARYTATPAVPPSEIDMMRQELQDLRHMVTLSLLQQQSATDRLKGVSWSGQIDAPRNDIVQALLDALANDPNVNVRLASLDALERFADREPVRRAAVDAVETQMSPLVQIALIDFIVKTGERESLDVLKRIADDPQVHEAVRARATWGVQMLG